MLHVVLYQPEIPPNTGNIIRLCANTDTVLHLIHPLGFTITDKQVARAGLDYHELAKVFHYDSFEVFHKEHHKKRIFACTTKGEQLYTNPHYQSEDMFLFGQETKGLPEVIRQQFTQIYLPMQVNSRSLNLSNAVAIILFEGLRQQNFKDLVLK